MKVKVILGLGILPDHIDIAATAPGTVFINTEDGGTDSFELPITPQLTSREEMLDFINQFFDEIEKQIESL